MRSQPQHGTGPLLPTSVEHSLTAALRVARFGTANEHSDWETTHHIFTYANAVHQALKRIDSGTPTQGDHRSGIPPSAAAKLQNTRLRRERIKEGRKIPADPSGPTRDIDRG
jgi:hypothetical protein